jgi:hypothetical protein
LDQSIFGGLYRHLKLIFLISLPRASLQVIVRS